MFFYAVAICCYRLAYMHHGDTLCNIRAEEIKKCGMKGYEGVLLSKFSLYL